MARKTLWKKNAASVLGSANLPLKRKSFGVHFLRVWWGKESIIIWRLSLVGYIDCGVQIQFSALLQSPEEITSQKEKAVCEAQTNI